MLQVDREKYSDACTHDHVQALFYAALNCLDTPVPLKQPEAGAASSQPVQLQPQDLPPAQAVSHTQPGSAAPCMHSTDAAVRDQPMQNGAADNHQVASPLAHRRNLSMEQVEDTLLGSDASPDRLSNKSSLCMPDDTAVGEFAAQLAGGTCSAIPTQHTTQPDQPHSMSALHQDSIASVLNQQPIRSRDIDAQLRKPHYRLGHNPYFGTDHLQPEAEPPEPELTWQHQAGAIFALFALYYAQPEQNNAPQVYNLDVLLHCASAY